MMRQTSRSRAAELFAATQKKTERILTEIEKARQEKLDKMAKQRAQRLAKEAADSEAADKAIADKSVNPKPNV